MMRRALIGTAILLLSLFLFLPLAFVFVQALKSGGAAYVAAVTDPGTRAAIRLTLIIAAVAVPLNVVFGVVAAWALTKFDVPGRTVLVTLIDLPFAVSPVVAGLVLVLLLGKHGVIGPWLAAHDITVIFAVPGMILATVFVTFPFVVRELLPIMQAEGREPEEAAVLLGASGWQTFWRVTLPSIRWGVLYGTLLCAARAIGEFGAVSVVSGHVLGMTMTVPLHVEMLYNDYQLSAAFAVASLLTIVALVALVAEHMLHRRTP
jgi:sulfate transport system permease protein